MSNLPALTNTWKAKDIILLDSNMFLSPHETRPDNETIILLQISSKFREGFDYFRRDIIKNNNLFDVDRFMDKTHLTLKVRKYPYTYDIVKEQVTRIHNGVSYLAMENKKVNIKYRNNIEVDTHSVRPAVIQYIRGRLKDKEVIDFLNNNSHLLMNTEQNLIWGKYLVANSNGVTCPMEIIDSYNLMSQLIKFKKDIDSKYVFCGKMAGLDRPVNFISSKYFEELSRHHFKVSKTETIRIIITETKERGWNEILVSMIKYKNDIISDFEKKCNIMEDVFKEVNTGDNRTYDEVIDDEVARLLSMNEEQLSFGLPVKEKNL